MSSKKLTNDIIVKAILDLIAVIAIVIVLINHDKIKILNLPGENIKPYNWILVAISFVIAYYLQVICHEFGHFIGGKLSKFKLYYYKVGPLAWERLDDKLQFELDRKWGWLGTCRMLPMNTNNLHGKLAIYYLGGIIINITLTIVFVLCSIYVSPGINNSFIAAFFISSWLVGIYQVTLNLLPINSYGIKSDGLFVISLIRKKNNDIAKLFIILIRNQLMAGIRPADIDESFYNDSKYFSDKDLAGLTMNNYRFYHYLDLGDNDKAIRAMKLIEVNIDECPEAIRLGMLYNVFYTYCVLKQNKDKANKIYEEIKDSVSNSKTILEYRIRMAYELYINNDYTRAMEVGRYGLSFEDEYPVRGEGIFEADQIRKMMSTARADFIR